MINSTIAKVIRVRNDLLRVVEIIAVYDVNILSRPVFEKTCQQLKKRKKSCFWDFEKRQKT